MLDVPVAESVSEAAVAGQTGTRAEKLHQPLIRHPGRPGGRQHPGECRKRLSVGPELPWRVDVLAVLQNRKQLAAAPQRLEPAGIEPGPGAEPRGGE